MTKQQNSTISDAPESNAGDDFHVLWSVRKALQLLNTDDSPLKAITLEGVLPKESKKIDPTGAKLLGVDITEYYGAESFRDSQTVLFSQLKYSTRNAGKPWTVNAISKSNKNKKDPFAGSIIHRLASIFSTYSTEYSKSEVLKKMKLKLVSNRSLSNGVSKLISDIHLYFSSVKSPTLAILKNKFPNHATNIGLLQEASRLSSADFIYFLKLLDFSDCGAKSRFAQKQKAIEAIVAFSGFESSTLAELKDFVWDRMMPENRNNNLITDKDVLTIFGFGQVKDLFPAESKIEECINYIKRECYTNLQNKIIEGPEKKFYLHAGAGYGKSTFVSHLTDSLPEGSECILFDCYGGGTYLDPSDKRHKHEWGILQIASELAQKIGTPFLLMQHGASEQYLRELKKRLQQAVNIIKTRSSDAILLLIMDAADNSLIAANEQNEKSFIADLIQETLPDGCKLLITMRTSRVKMFNFPFNEFAPLQINTFDKDETAIYLKSIKDGVTDKFIEEFHRLTNGIPRVQSYALSTKDAEPEDILSPLRPDGKTLNDIFADQIKVASKRFGDIQKSKKILEFLTNLPTPIPLTTLALIAEIEEEMAHDFIIDLHPGLILSNGYTSFKDEDFQAYLKDSYSIDTGGYDCIARKMLSTANESEYSCLYVAHFLLKAGNSSELQQIVLQQTHISAISEPIRQKQLLIERTRLAMQSTNPDTDLATFIRLQLLAAETAKTNDILQKLLIDNADLVALYGLPDNNKEDYSFNHSWYGEYYAKKAASLSRKPQFYERAKAYLKEAESWFHWCSRQKDNQANFCEKYSITIEDLKNATETHLNISGIDNAISYARSWEPKKSIFYAIKEIAFSLLDQKKPESIIGLLNRKNLRVDIKLLLLQCLMKYGIIPESVDFSEYIAVLLRFKGRIRHAFKEPIISFCELLAYKKQEKEAIILLTQLLVNIIPEHLPSFYNRGYGKKEIDRFDISCRVKSLLAQYAGTEITSNDFIPQKIKKNLKSKEHRKLEYTKDKKQEYDRLYGFVLPFYKLRTQTYLGILSQEQFKAAFNQLVKMTEGNWELKHYSHDVNGLFDFLACRFLDILPLITNKDYLLTQIHNTFIRSKGSKKTDILISTANRISKIHIADTDRLTLKYINQADEIIRHDLLTLDNINNYYIRATRALNRIEPSFGKLFFLKAINAVNLVDDNAYYQVEALYTLSKAGLVQPSPQLAFEVGKYVEYAQTILSGYEHFPIKEGLFTLANIDPGSALAFLCRWDHRNILKIDDYTAHTFDYLHQAGYINAACNAALQIFSPYYYYDNFLEVVQRNLADFTEQKLFDERRLYVEQLIRDVKINVHANTKLSNLKKLEKTFQDNCIEKEVLSELRSYIHKYEALHPQKTYNSSYRSDREAFDWEAFTENADFIQVDNLEKIFQRIKQEKDKLFVSGVDFIEYAACNCSLIDQRRFIESICSIDPPLIGYYDFTSSLKRLLDNWKDNPLILDWLENNQDKIVERWLLYMYIESNNSILYYVEELAELFQICREKLSSIIINTLPHFIQELNSENLYKLLKITSVGIKQNDAEEIIRETVVKWSKPIKEDFGDGAFTDQIRLTASVNEAIANVFRYTLGHPDKKIRWKSVHALRRLVTYSPDQTILQLLIQKQNNETCFPFQHKDYIYFWLSAKLYLWMCINRIANENPQKLKVVIPFILAEVQNQALPHLLIQLFINRACKLLCNADLVENKQLLLEQIEKPLINEITEELPEIIFDDDKWRFDFDHMDTIPYWYESLGRYFELNRNTIAFLAQDIICNKWHFTGNVRDKNHVYPAGGYWHLTSKRHGSVPQIEDLQTYYEYHAMFCVAARLLKTRVLSNDDYTDFDEWLERYATTWEDKWLSDLRDPEPLLPIMYPINSNNEDWITTIGWKEYDDYIGLQKNDYLVTDASFSKYYWKDYESVSIDSAFVAADKAQSLLCTLNDYENHHCYVIPSEEDSEGNLAEDGFVLKGFHQKVESTYGEMDEHDPCANKTSKLALIPGQMIINHKGLKVSDDNRFSFGTNKTNPISVFENWNDLTDRESSQKTSGGHHFMIQKNYILEIIQKYNYCLLIKCAISRSKKKEHSGEKNKYSEFLSLHLLYPNGTVETRRSIKNREEDY